MTKISVVINTLNEEANIKRAMASVAWADEIVVCDMYSEDKTVEIAKKLGAKVVYHKKADYVEPARNFALSKASGDWILVLDADEEIPDHLAKRLKEIAQKMKQIDVIQIPRKNIIFGKWMKASMWWPDYQVRFFKAGKVRWRNEIHSKPKVTGENLELEPEEKWAIIHYNYNSLSQYIDRMNRYTAIEAKELVGKGYKFCWEDLIQKPISEFLSRFFVSSGYKDGLHGLALSLLQAASFLAVYLKVWEIEGFKQQELNMEELKTVKTKAGEELEFWFKKTNAGESIFKTFLKKFKS